MCGRFAITLPPEAVRGFFAYVEQPNFPPRYNIAPTQPIPIVAAQPHTGGKTRHFTLMRWGFLPGFVKNPKEFPLIINARAETIFEKASFRAAFDGFEPAKIARYKPAKIEALMQDAGIVRNRAKIEAAIALAKIYLDLQEGDGFAKYIWGFVDGRAIQNKRNRMSDVPPQTDISVAMGKDLRQRGANFVGPTIIYAFMQATGIVNDHLAGCYRCAECAALA